jgi:hypothetical protein
MPLRGRVGRHAKTGAQCQNWADDQQTVISLLNLIPAADGGANGSLGARVVAGIAGDDLFKAILRFQVSALNRHEEAFSATRGDKFTSQETVVSQFEICRA